MKLLRFRQDSETHAGILISRGVVPIQELNSRTGSHLPNDVLEIIRSGTLSGVDVPDNVEILPYKEVVPILPYDVPPKIWCIGLNYKSHADDIQAVQPE